MTHQTACVALWGGLGSKALLHDLHGQPLLQRTLRRVGAAGLGKAYVLIPWAQEHDALADVAKAWAPVRCHPEERIAMRDLVAFLRADIGILVQGHAADVDAAEIRLAYSRIATGLEAYKTARVAAFKAERWLSVSDTDEWGALRSLEDLRRFYAREQDLTADTRELRGRSQAD